MGYNFESQKKNLKRSTRLLSQDKKYENKKIYIYVFFYFENTEAHYNITIYLFYIFIFVSSIKYIFIWPLYLHFIRYTNLGLNQIIKHKSSWDKAYKKKFTSSYRQGKITLGFYILEEK